MVNYEKQNFADGQILTADCLNRMEKGIKDACESVPSACKSADCSKVLSYGAAGFEWVDRIIPANQGGYYIPAITQVDANTIKISFTASKDGMEAIGDQTVTLPAGRGIVSITRTSGNGAAGTTDVYTISYSDETTSTFTVYNGANGKDGTGGSGGSGSGENGATFTPYVDSDGNLSWSNDKGLANPDTVNIKGNPGKDGTPCTHKWDGTKLTITSASGTSTADLAGTPGKNGVDITNIEQTTTSDADGGTNVITISRSDGTSHKVTIKNGSKGSPGENGENGKSAYRYAVDGGYTGTEADFKKKMAATTITQSIEITPSWVSNQVRINVPGITADEIVFVAPDPGSYTAYTEAGVRCTTQEQDYLSFECNDAPTETITVNLVRIKGAT